LIAEKERALAREQKQQEDDAKKELDKAFCALAETTTIPSPIRTVEPRSSLVAAVVAYWGS
jgi:hypothetical protein